MNKVATGLIFLVFGIWGAVAWWWFIMDVLKGLVVILLVAAGLIMVGLGIKDMGLSEPERGGRKTL